MCACLCGQYAMDCMHVCMNIYVCMFVWAICHGCKRIKSAAKPADRQVGCWRCTNLHQCCQPLVRKSGNAAAGKRTHCRAGILRPEVDRKQGRPTNALRALASGPTRRSSPQSLHRHTRLRRAARLPAAALAKEDWEPWVHPPRLRGRAVLKECVQGRGPVHAQRPQEHHRGSGMPRAAKHPHSSRGPVMLACSCSWRRGKGGR